MFFLHGFNVDTNEARAWSAEMFKRLYQSGSRARFWGMTWDGDVGFPNGLHYHEDVTNAFAVAADFAARLQAVPGEKIVLAHSLGNMVVSEAIQSNGLTVDKYFMLNAAVPSESYDTMAFNASSANNLVPEEWVGYTNVAWASKWHELFPANDDRSRLTWRGRFAGVTGVAYNYYSSQDEIFELKPGGAGSFSGGPLHLERYAWQKQEMLKGTGYIGGTTWAGWGMRYANPTSSVPLYTAAEANTIAATNKWHFCEMPLFWLSPDFMFASSISDIHRNEILGRGIPAMSPPTGLGRIPAVVNHSFGEFRLEGIWGRSENNYYGLRWKHSDIKNMAYLYIYKAFDTIAEEGALK